MKAGTIAKMALALLVAAGATYAVKPELFKDILPESKATATGKKKKAVGIRNIGIVKGAEWVDCAKVRDKVAAEINKKLANTSESSVAEFLKKPENRLLLAQWIVADAELRFADEVRTAAEKRAGEIEKARKELETLRADLPAGATAPAAMAWNMKKLESKIAKLEAEQKSDHLFSESAAGKGGSKLMERICNDPEWMEQLAFSGECVRPGMVLSILKKISAEHKDMVKNPMVRQIATATALEYAKSSWNQQDAVERAGFYIQAWKDGRLNSSFDTLPMWQRRMVCGCKGDNAYGSIASLTWALDNIHLPADRYTDVCWRCSYRLFNIYTDTIHGPHYYAPFESELGNNREAMTYIIGGVCGSLSHFGAFAALANGIPAMTSGEPGHCAFIVKVGEKWTPAYSMSWQRGLHWQVFRNVYSFSSLHSATDLYSEEQKEQTALSNALRVCGNIKASAGDLSAAASCFEKAASLQPCNWMVWREWMETLNANNAASGYWSKMNDTLCEKLVPIYPEMGFEMMQKGMVDGLAKALGNSPAQLRKAYLKYWQSIKEMGPDRWHIETLADKQLAGMGITPDDVDGMCSYYSDVLSLLVSDEKYGPAILNWGNTLSAKLNTEQKSRFTRAMLSGISKSSDMTPEARMKMLRPAILSAEKSRDLDSFRSIGKMIADMGHTNPDVKIPAFEPFPGKLASEGGLIWASSTSDWDKPHEHAMVLTPRGGSFHTGRDENAWVAVQLPRQVYVTGIVLAAVQGSQHRLNNMKIQVSENGEDWTDVAQLGNFSGSIMRSDLGGKQPVAKYVRILRPGREVFHLNGIYIYGNQAA